MNKGILVSVFCVVYCAPVIAYSFVVPFNYAECCDRKENIWTSVKYREIFTCENARTEEILVFDCSRRHPFLSRFTESLVCKSYTENGRRLQCVDVSEKTIGLEVRFFKTLRWKTNQLATITGVISLLSASVILMGLVAYGVQWKSLNVYRWTQFSLLLAIFITFSVAGVRRLIAKEFRYPFLEFLEDYGCTTVSTNLILISLDLLYMIWKVLPPHHQWHSYKRFAVSIVIAWAVGIFVALVPLIRSHSESTLIVESTRKSAFLERIMEKLLCIQMYSTSATLSTWLTYIILFLFSINALFFLIIGAILYKRRKSLKIMLDCNSGEKLLRDWGVRYFKLFLLMGLWWPMNIICIFQCLAIRDEILSIWDSIQTPTDASKDNINYEVPWHMYVVQNCLAVQAIIISIILVLNKRTLKNIKTLYNIG